MWRIALIKPPDRNKLAFFVMLAPFVLRIRLTGVLRRYQHLMIKVAKNPALEFLFSGDDVHTFETVA